MKKIILSFWLIALAACSTKPKVIIADLPPDKPVCQENTDDIRVVGFELRVQHYFGESESIISNEKQREK